MANINSRKSESEEQVPPLANDAIEEWVEAVVGTGKNPPGDSTLISTEFN